jgi:hypothetical protein
VKASRREFLKDVRGAARLGHALLIEQALLPLRRFPQIASNHPLEQATIHQLIFPLGQALSAPAVPGDVLQALMKDSLTALRAASAVALSLRFLQGERELAVDLVQLAHDPRPEVSFAMQLALESHGAANPEALLALGADWLGADDLRLRALALNFLRCLAPTHGDKLLSLTDGIYHNADRAVRAALANCYIALGQAGNAPALLEHFNTCAEDRRARWAICRALSASWAAEHPSTTRRILAEIEACHGPSRHVNNARRALERHHQPN